MFRSKMSMAALVLAAAGGTLCWAGELGYWSFGECSGTIVHDASAAGNDGTIWSEDMWVSPGYRETGCALAFAGSASSSVVIPDEDSLDFTGSIYISAQVKWRALSAGSAIVRKGATSAPYTLSIRPDETGSGVQVVASFNNNTGGTNFECTTPQGAMPADGEFHHIEMSYDQSACRIWIDGVLMADEAASWAIVNNDEPLYIGYNPAEAPGRFEGQIDEVFISNGGRACPPGGADLSGDLTVRPGFCPNPLVLAPFGVVQLAVAGTPGFDVAEIDPATITLSVDGMAGSISPIGSAIMDITTPLSGDICDCSDLTGDGIDDLSVWFWTGQIAEMLDGRSKRRLPSMTLTISGLTSGGQCFEASDCVSAIMYARTSPVYKGHGR
ncbi:MAG: LamG-like jellyroll fold domain-containing protein [Phycisphaerae bacterium]